jgi:hypothetical protein
MLFFSFAPDFNSPSLLRHCSFDRPLSDSPLQLASSSILAMTPRNLEAFVAKSGFPGATRPVAELVKTTFKPFKPLLSTPRVAGETGVGTIGAFGTIGTVNFRKAETQASRPTARLRLPYNKSAFLLSENTPSLAVASDQNAPSASSRQAAWLCNQLI